MSLTLRQKVMREAGRDGGKAKSPAKTKSSRKNLEAFWDKVRAGKIKHPITGKKARCKK